MDSNRKYVQLTQGICKLSRCQRTGSVCKHQVAVKAEIETISYCLSDVYHLSLGRSSVIY
jgi:hypothetical protein